jgi:phosphatidylserine/phosphatidylglycerophosphate/cardiolipin synthase-like enzyme
MKFAFSVIIFLYGFLASATMFPIDLNGNTEVLVIDNPTDDETIRLELLSQAKKSIDVIAHTQSTGDFGLKVLNVLRDRMANNVKVRYMYEKIASMGVGETTDRAINLFTDETLYEKNQSELIVNRPLQKMMSPYTLSDLFHEKIIIIDRGTENEKLIIGGRNHDEFSVTSSDFTFVLRRVDKKKAYLGDSLQAHFDDLFSLAKRYFKVEKARKLTTKEAIRLANDSANLNFQRPTSLAQEILDTVSSPLNQESGLKRFQFVPSKTRLVTNDLLKNIADNKLPKNYFVRRDMLNDDITSYFSGLVDNASKLEMTSYILAMPDLIKDSVKSMVADGGTFVSYSNDGLAYGRKLPFKALGNAVHSMNIESYFHFGGNENSSAVSMYTLDPKQGDKQESPVDYNHRKVAIVDVKSGVASNKPQRIIFTGSYNFTLSSASKNDEMAIMFADTRMADYISDINKRDADAYYLKLEPLQAMKILKSNKTALRVCRRLFESIF